MKLEEALKEQIKYCFEISNFRCCVYIKHQEKREHVMDVLQKLLSEDKRVDKIINYSYYSIIYFDNGSSISIIYAGDGARMHRNNGAIIDNEIDKSTIDCRIMPTLLPRWINEHEREPWEEVKKRIIYCSF